MRALSIGRTTETWHQEFAKFCRRAPCTKGYEPEGSKLLHDTLFNVLQKDLRRLCIMQETKDPQLFPSEIILEVTNHCNLRCRHCHFHGNGAVRGRPLAHMPPAVWEMVLDEIAEWAQPVHILTHGAGEPLLYPQLGDVLEKARRIPHAGVGFMTNGMLLSREWIDKLIDMQVHFVALSIDGVDPESHDRFRRHARLKTIEENVNFLIESKTKRRSRYPELTFNMVAYPEIESQKKDYVRRWIPHAQQVTVSKFRPIGSKRLWLRDEIVDHRPCPLLYNQCVIGVNGDIGLCCEDIHLEVVSGNVTNSRLLDIYNKSSILNRYRRLHENKKKDELYLCKECDVWGGDMTISHYNENIEGHDITVNETYAYTSYVKNFPKK